MNFNFDTEKFIEEIQEREAIWNGRGAAYNNKVLKCKQWEELVDIFGKEDMKVAERKNIRKELQKKWKNIRDNFVRTLRENTSKSGSAAKKKTQYIYYNSLMFLKDTVSFNKTDSNMQRKEDGNITDEDNDLVAEPPPKRKKKIKKEVITDEITDYLTDDIEINNVELKNAEEDEDRLFCLSLVKEIKKVPERLRLQTKVRLLQVITDAQISRYINSNSKRKKKP